MRSSTADGSTEDVLEAQGSDDNQDLFAKLFLLYEVGEDLI